MKLKQVHLGIHTIELYAVKLKYHQIQKTIDHLVDQRSIQQIYSDSYSIDRHLKSTYLVDQGSLILSAVNREISAAGYLNQLGLAHENTYNPFNLGCDLMEPLRPLVDSTVLDLHPERLERAEKLVLVNLLNREVLYDGKRQYLLYAMRLYCGGLFRALQSGDMSEIKWIDYEW